MKVLKAGFVKVLGTPIEIGFGVICNFNKNVNLLSGDFTQIVVLQKFTRDDTSTSVYKSANFSDKFTKEDFAKLQKIYFDLQEESEKLFTDFKEKTGAHQEKDKEKRMQILRDFGYVITTKDSEE